MALSSRELAELEHDVAILAACLTSRDGLPAVPNARWLESHLTSTGLARLSKQATEALQAIGPVWAAVDLGAWTATLKLGAQHPANYLDAYALGGCIDLVGSGEGTKLLPRPDRFFGVPMSQLVDGHWLAYRAARFIFEGNT